MLTFHLRKRPPPKALVVAPRTVIAHAIGMVSAVTLSGVGLLGRVDEQLAVAAPPPLWAIASSGMACAFMIASAYLGGDLVYRHGVNVQSNS